MLDHERTQSPASLVFDSSDGREHLELVCYKTIVACHLYGISHDSIADGVWKVAKGCWRTSTNSDEWQSLVWLSSMGMNVPQILHDLYTQAQRRVKGVSSYPEEEKEAIRLGLEIFGKEWVKIRDYFKVFEGSSRSHLKVRTVTRLRVGKSTILHILTSAFLSTISACLQVHEELWRAVNGRPQIELIWHVD